MKIIKVPYDIGEKLSAKHKGPIHIEFPDDIQRQSIAIDEKKLKSISIEAFHDRKDQFVKLEKSITDALSEYIKYSKKIGFILGAGCNSVAQRYMTDLIDICENVPVLSTWGSIHTAKAFPKYISTIGTYGNNLGNQYLSECDLWICLGTRLSNNIISSLPSEFADHSKKIIINHDIYELNKPTTREIKNALAIHASIEEFILTLKDLPLTLNAKVTFSGYSPFPEKNKS